MKKLSVITSLLISGVVIIGSTITMTSCKTNDSKWDFFFTHDDLYNGKWISSDAPFQSPMSQIDYTTSPYTNSTEDPLMCKDIQNKLTINSLVGGMVRTELEILNEQEGYTIEDFGINVSFDKQHLINMHWKINVKYVEWYNKYLWLVHHQVAEFYSIKPVPVCFARQEGKQSTSPPENVPVISLGDRSIDGPCYWHYDLWDSSSKSNEIHTDCIQEFMFMYPKDWDNVTLPIS